MLKAQELGHTLYHYPTDWLSYSGGRVYAGAQEVTVQRVAGDHFCFGEFTILDLSKRRGRRADAAEPAVRPRLHKRDASARADRTGETLRVVDNTAAVRNAAEKGSGCSTSPSSCHRPRVTRSLGHSPASSSPNRATIVIKPLHGFAGGSGVPRRQRRRAISPRSSSCSTATYREPHVLQKFLPEIAEGDKRIVLVDGEIAGAINRVPAKGEIRSNLAVGGMRREKTELTDREREICAGARSRAQSGASYSSASTLSAAAG